MGRLAIQSRIGAINFDIFCRKHKAYFLMLIQMIQSSILFSKARKAYTCYEFVPLH